MENSQSSDLFELETKDRLGYTAVVIQGSFTVKNLFQVRTRLQELIEDSVTNIVFDFKECREIDSSGLGLLSNLYKRLGHQGGELGVIHVGPEISKILTETGLNNILTDLGTLEDADAHFD